MRFKLSIALPVFGVLLAGCFTQLPVDRAVPELGTEVALDINDAGRVALGPSMVPEIGQVQGRLVQRDAQEYAVAVTAVQFLRGGSQSWTGEVVHVKSDYVSAYYEHQFSPARTAALSAAVVGGLVLVGRQALNGSSTGEVAQNPSPPASIQRSGPGVRIPISPLQTLRVLERLLPHFVKH